MNNSHICSLYTNLKVNKCIDLCTEAFSDYKHLISYPFELSENNVKTLMQWSLMYSYLEFNNQMYYQHKGIQMGNNASVSIANITVSKELRSIFSGKNEIFFHPRFIDDIFMIIDGTNINDIN